MNTPPEMTAPTAKTFAALLAAAEKREKKFNKLSKTAKRIAIAKDTVAAINAGTVVPSLDTGYLDAELPEGVNIRTQFLVGQALNTPVHCSACALGSMFVVKVLITNAVDAESRWDREEIVEELVDIFSQAQLDLIESAYEGVYVGTFDAAYQKRWQDKHPALLAKLKRAVAFSDRYASASRRMRAIMRNIIKNNGVFAP